MLVYAESLVWRFENTLLASLLMRFARWLERTAVWQFFSATWLGKKTCAHYRRMVLSVVISLPLIAYGLLLLHSEVAGYGMDPSDAYITNWPVITGLAFVSNRWLLFKDRETPWLTALWRWVAISLGHTTISFSAFRVMVDDWGWQYLVVSVVLIPALALGSYILRNGWAFARVRMTAP